MGQDVIRNTTKSEVVAELNRDCTSHKVIDHALRGSRLWQVLERKDNGRRHIRVTLVTQSRGVNEVTTKSLSEEEHPYYYDCPLPVRNGGMGWQNSMVPPSLPRSELARR